MPEENSRKPPETYVMSPEEIMKLRERLESLSPLEEIPEAPQLTAFLRELFKEKGMPELAVWRLPKVEVGAGDEVYAVLSGKESVGGCVLYPRVEGETERERGFHFTNTDILPGDYRGKTVVLMWDNRRYVEGMTGMEREEEVPGEWKRQDPFTEIPFP